MLTLDEIHPTQDRVLVKPDPVPTVTPGGIHIPETVNADNPNYYTMTGTILKVGPGARDSEDGRRLAIPVEIGQRIVFGRYEGKQVVVDGVTLLLMRAEKIMGLADEERVQHGYEAPKHGPIKGTPRPGAPGYDLHR